MSINIKKYTKDPAADVMQEHMDRVMAQIIGGKQELRPFPERYHELRKVTYSRRGNSCPISLTQMWPC